MTKNLFGTDGIRGRAGTYPLTFEGARQVGRAISTNFATEGDLTVIGFDTRESSPALAAGLSKGLTETGMNVGFLDVVPTPAVSYIAKQLGAAAGVMITASHNPYKDNGIKVFNGDGSKLDDYDQIRLNNLINGTKFNKGSGKEHDSRHYVHYYLEYLASTAGEGFSDIHIALDMANGATTEYASRVFKMLGAKVLALFDKPSGININEECGATNTRALEQTIRQGQANIGAAFDGDGDRIMMVDEKSRQLNGDHLLYINAVARGETGVVATQMSNKGLESALNEKGIQLHRTDVGDRYVYEGLRQNNLILGGEQSGHLIFKDLMPTGDGILAAIQTIRNYRAKEELSAWCDEVPMLPQTIVNVRKILKNDLEQPKVKKLIQKYEEQLGNSGRLNIRASGTEDLVRVMVEAENAQEMAEQIAGELRFTVTGW